MLLRTWSSKPWSLHSCRSGLATNYCIVRSGLSICKISTELRRKKRKFVAAARATADAGATRLRGLLTQKPSACPEPALDCRVAAKLACEPQYY